ncbi:3'(2'),5'-bisphosphate nucleotidase CysQ [Asticcacaulis sp. AC402]|uniref:3'(2'),5'-bisphosphate nucleotidase CysQ n=1 Tax=Asticcacaulis sp. AC402 TaxID=1282361 RepID=UPI0003C3CF55|nr:3'(2'),5'-bisphosphate nucleotidase CysQ [Asticcacaulis sp. AC402]ESQ73910.1 3'-5'-bisphosphate nucleotidase [Asticcacaulis sp. AC402]
MNLNPIMLAAGAEILRIYATDFAVMSKSDASPVTAADQAAETVILKGLRELAPDIPVVAEEEAAAGRIPQTGKRFFLVDPLDGTREFISKNGEFTVNIALIEDGIPVMGAVFAPALGRIYWGATGKGAFMADISDGAVGPARQIMVRPAPAALTAIGSRSHGGAETEAYLKAFAVAEFKPAGSSLKFCLIAAGEADIYPRMGRTMEWDTAAGDAVLRAAGGRVETLDGRPLAYGKRNTPGETDFANPHFVAFGDPAIESRCPAP